MTDSTTAPRAPAASRRGLILSVALGLAVLAAIALDTTVVKVGSEADARQQAFSPDTYGTQEFPRIRDAVIERAVPATDLAAAIAADQDAAIDGTDLRDAPGDIAFGAFKNQIEYQDAGSGINRAMAAEVLAPIDTTALAGKQVTVTGAFRLINPSNWLITPVALEVQ